MQDMVVLPASRSVAFPVNDKTERLAELSTSQRINIKGKDVWLLPHNTMETIQANILGFPVPSPMWYRYNWSGIYTPMEHQMQTSAFLTQYSMSLVLNDIGTGKTLSSLWAADFLIKENMVHRWVIIAPLSTLQNVWANTLFTHFPHLSNVILHGDRAKRQQLLNENYQMYIINHDGLSMMLDELMERDDIHGVIFDEAAEMRNRKQLYKSFMAWVRTKHIKWRWLLTGTPTPNAPTDAYALANTIESSRIQNTSFEAFRDKVMYRDGRFSYVARPNAAETVSNTLWPAIRYRRHECIDLPPTTIVNHYAPMTGTQQKVYDEMFKKLVVEYEEGLIEASNETIKTMKLCQIAAGVLYDTEKGGFVILNPLHKLKELKALIDGDGGKVIVYLNFTHSIGIVKEYLDKFYTTNVVYSKTAKGERNKIFNDFQNEDNPRVLIAHPNTMAHGLTLTRARTIIWFSPTNSNNIYDQAGGRITRIGQDQKTTIIHLTSSDAEDTFYQRLKDKQKLQGMVLQLVEARNPK